MVKVAIVGMGRMGRMYAQIAKQMREVRLVGVCDADPTVADALRKALDVPCYTELDRMLDEVRADALCVCTPDDSHLAPTLAALERNLHIMVEKPLATSAGEARHMAEEAARHRVVAQMAYVFRWHPPYVQAYTAARNGELGKLLSISARMDDRIFVPTRMLRWASRTSPAWFLLSHMIDVVRWIGNEEIIWVRASGVKHKLLKAGIDTYDLIHTEMGGRQGLLINLEACWVWPDSFPAMADTQCHIVGTDRSIRINTGYQMLESVGPSYEWPATFRSPIHRKSEGLQTPMFVSFIDSIIDGCPPIVGLEDGLRAVEILEAIDRSLEKGSETVALE